MKYTNGELMEKAPVTTAMFRLAIPTVLGMIVQLIYNITDTYFVGLQNDYNQLAAVSLAMPLMLTSGALSHIFSMGAPSYISRLLGQRQYDEVKKTSSFAFYTTIIMGLVITGIVLLNLDQITWAIGASNETYTYTFQYVFVIVCFSILGMMSGTLQGLLRSEGSTKLASIGMIVGAIANMILDPLFIFVFGMGVKGAAIATVIGNGLSLLFFLLIMKRRKSYISIALKHYRPDLKMIREIMSIGLPSSLSQIIMSITMVFTNNMAAAYGDYVVAASNIAGKAYMIVIMIIMGITMGLQPFFGFNFGARNFRRLIRGIWACLIFGSGLCLAAAVFFFMTPGWFMGIFSNDPQVQAIGIIMMKRCIISLPLIAIQMTFLTYLQATGQAVRSMIINLSRQCLIYLPVVFLMNRFMQLKGLLMSQPIADVATTLLAVTFVVPEIKK